MREHVRRFVCWLLGHHPVGPPFYSPMCARCGLILHDNCSAWGADPEWDAFVEARTTCPVDGTRRCDPICSGCRPPAPAGSSGSAGEA